MIHDTPDSTHLLPSPSRFRAGWALPSLCLALVLGCDTSDPVNDADPVAGAGARAGAAGSSRADGQLAPVPSGTAPAAGVDQTATQAANVGGPAGGSDAPQNDAVEGAAADAGVGDAPADAGSGDAGGDAAEPALDENVVFIQQDGFQTTYFAADCRSVAEDGSVLEGVDPLPVGGGNVLECATSVIGARATQDFLASTGERWCALGELDTFSASGDPSLVIEIADAPDDAPWTLIGTHEGDVIDIGTVVVFGATAWPLWVDTHYAVAQVAPNPNGQLCDELFGLVSP